MNRKVLAIAVGGVALGVLALPAAAQTSKPVGLSIRAGVVFPTNGNNDNTVLLGAGLEFNLTNVTPSSMGLNNSGHVSLSADYYGKNNAFVIPVMLNYVGTANGRRQQCVEVRLHGCDWHQLLAKPNAFLPRRKILGQQRHAL
jgi:hypothetical protein